MIQYTSVIANKFSKSFAIVLTLASLVYAIPATAQQRNFGNRDRSWQGDDTRRQISRPPSIHQRPQATFNNPDNTRRIENRNDQRAIADNFNRRSFDRSSSVSTNRAYRQNIDQNVRRNYPNDLNRGGIGYSKPGVIYNRPGFRQNHIDRSYDYRGYNKGYNSYRSSSYNAYNPNWRYAYAPRRYSVFNTLPSFYLSLNFGGSHYRYYDGIYYRPYNNVFRVVPAPIGIFVNTLPVGHRRIFVGNYPYYYYNGTYYDHRDNYYTVVSPPLGAVVESLPDGYKTITIDGETYYEVDGAQYKPVVQENGEIWYEVIKSN
jgi:hypothetical protein